ncbi:uncharacterized protein LOC142356566, partial [Convolutriloba macropyga]|uniref:uncharacterized protein LOC142356566 n=1 Tax=Convolutriloba macropyga TaxID=536237 RepID=UPI003F526114
LGQFICVVSLYLASKCTNVLTMFSTLGLGYGVGCNLVYYSVSIQGTLYFPSRTQIKECKAANAFTQIALPLAQVISGFIFTYFKNSSGWQDAIQFSAILLFVVGYLSLAALEYLSKSYSKSQPEAQKNAKTNQAQRSVRMKLVTNFKRQFSTQTLRLPAFYWLNMDLFLFWASNLVGLMFLPTEMKANGYTDLQIQILTLQGVTGVLGRLGLSALPIFLPGQIKFFRIFPMKGAILAVCFLSSFALGSPWSYYVLTMGVGLSSAIAGAPLLNVSEEVLGKKMNAFTWTLLSVGSGGMFGPILGGAVFDLSGSYRLAFEIASTLACVSATLSVLAAISRHSKERKRSMHEESLRRHRSHKLMPVDTLAPTLYIRRSPQSYFVFEKQGDKYQYSRIIDKFEYDDTTSRKITNVDELFHGKFDIANAYLPYDLEDDPTQDFNSEPNVSSVGLHSSASVLGSTRSCLDSSAC